MAANIVATPTKISTISGMYLRSVCKVSPISGVILADMQANAALFKSPDVTRRVADIVVKA
jgi:hypothetical protein